MYKGSCKCSFRYEERRRSEHINFDAAADGNTDDAMPSISQQEEHEPDNPASVHCRDSEQSKRSNVGHDRNHNAEIARVIPAATKENEQPLENEVHQVQDSTITSKLIQGAMDIPDIMENNYIMDEGFAKFL